MSAPATLTYASLKTDLENYAERHDIPFVTHIPRFIMLAENRIASETRGLGLLKVVTVTMRSPILAKPHRWRETASINANIDGKRKILRQRPYEYCRVFAPDEATAGIPRFYADYGYEHWLIVPTPKAEYETEIMYYERPEPLSDARQTNWTTQNAPQLLIYGALLEAQPFLKQDSRVELFKSLYAEAAAAVTAEAKRRAFDRSYGLRE
jgi:hypothetical protein